MAWSGSGTRVNGNPYLAINRSCASVWSGDTPTISAFSFANFFEKSRNSQDSLVQPGVSALGKKKITTFLPRSLESRNSPERISGARPPVWILICRDCKLNEGAYDQELPQRCGRRRAAARRRGCV